MTISASAKVKISIGGTTAAADASAYAALTWTQINEVETIGDFGDSAESIKFNSLSDGRVRKLKGARDAGTLEVTFGRDPADAGQVALRTADKLDVAHNFKIELADKPATGTSPKNSIFYFAGMVSVQNTIGGVNDVTKMKATIDITTEPLLVPASAS